MQEVQVIPPGQSGIRSPNHAFSIMMQARKEAREWEKKYKKSLPAPRDANEKFRA